MDYNGIKINWTPQEEAKIAEIKARPNRNRQHRGEDTLDRYEKYLRELWHYYDYFFHPELGYRDNKWEVMHE